MKNKKKKTKFKLDLNKIMKLVLVILVLAVIGLIIAYAVISINNNKKGDLSIAILEEFPKNEIFINLGKLDKGEEKEYIFNVSNYKDDKVSEEQVKYGVEFINEDKLAIELEMYNLDNEEKNILKDNKIENIEFDKDKKEEDIYKLVIKAKENIKEGDLIELLITDMK